MNRGLLYENNFRPQFSGHETFPLRYGWLKKVFDAVYELELQGKESAAKDLFLSDDAIARFGVGKNMVASMRHWADSCHIIEADGDKGIFTTDFAKLLLSDEGLDPWMENVSSIWAIHWNLASFSAKASYIWLFSHFNNNQFDRGTVTQHLLNLCENLSWKASSAATLKRDVECLVRTYVNKPSKLDDFTEDQIESPLAELGLIQPVNKNDIFQIKRGTQPSLGSGVFLYALMDFWKRYTGSSRTLSLETVAYEPCSPGRVFCLDEDAVAGRLYGIEKISKGLLTWSETAGLRQVIANKSLDKIDELAFLKSDYEKNTYKKAA
ncbi:MAG: DUF4007 family protein [Micavibrio sp.]